MNANLANPEMFSAGACRVAGVLCARCAGAAISFLALESRKLLFVEDGTDHSFEEEQKLLSFFELMKAMLLAQVFLRHFGFRASNQNSPCL